MPSIAAHMVVAKIIGEKLNIYNKDFIRGNILPDVVNIDDSHHKLKGKYFLIPDTNYYKQSQDLSNLINLGYYVHLLLDKYYLEEYIPQYVNDKSIFENGRIYSEYTILNYKLVNMYDLDVLYLVDILNFNDVYVDTIKLKKNIEFLNNKTEDDLEVLDLGSFSLFLENISIRICEEIKIYASKYS